ncbi:MAG: hypothetical protein K6E16_08290 [Lachnospiraceae bacterium]|nr:hypothetical protein [Lachnospiraceae bacterium]
MEALFSVLVYLVIGIFVFRKLRQVKRGDDKTNKGIGGAPQRAVRETVQKPVSYPGTVRRKGSNGVNAHMAREKVDIRSWEDRKNDWLARQMAEEKICERRVSEMFQLKLEHRYSCEAEMMKQFHHSACEAAGVDTGEHK